MLSVPVDATVVTVLWLPADVDRILYTALQTEEEFAAQESEGGLRKSKLP